MGDGEAEAGRRNGVWGSAGETSITNWLGRRGVISTYVARSMQRPISNVMGDPVS